MKTSCSPWGWISRPASWAEPPSANGSGSCGRRQGLVGRDPSELGRGPVVFTRQRDHTWLSAPLTMARRPSAVQTMPSGAGI